MHTKEPWHVRTLDGSMGCIDDKDDYAIANTQQRPHDMLHKERIANSRRIVACVNACAGIPTELIEQGGFAAVPVVTHREVKQQRDDLLAALKEIASMENRYDCGDWDEIEDARNIAKAAIAKAESL